MVTLETSTGHESRPLIQQQLENHWMLDASVAAEFAQSVSPEGIDNLQNILGPIESNPDAVRKRDENRQEVIDIFNGDSDKQLFIIGPCSLDTETDYTKLFDYIQELQEQHPEAVIAWRGNGAKPRSSAGNTGLFNSTVPGRRAKQLDIYKEAFKRGIPIFTEITDKDQLGLLAPYLTGAWLGARDMASTELRKTFSAYNLPVMVKNGVDGRVGALRDAIKAIRKNTDENDGSGVSLGHIAATCRHEDGGPAMFTVGEGNKNVAIIARGYELKEERYDGHEIEMIQVMNEAEAEQKAVEHLSMICMLAAEVRCAAILDGSHGVPGMLSINKKDGNRFLTVLRRFIGFAQEGKITNVNRLKGFLGEVSVNEGNTDVNLILTDQTRHELAEQIREFQELDKFDWQG